MLRPPVRPSRALAPRPLPLLRPLSTYSRVRPAWSGSNTAACGLAGLAVVAAAFPLLRYHQARGFSASSPLHCDEERKPTAREGDKGLFSSLPSVALPDLSLPKLPELPTIPTIDLNLSSWTDSFKPLQLLTDLQRELTAGEGSTLAKILASREDAELNPEVAWDAQVRLSTELGHAERAFLRVRKEAALKPFARLMGVEESEVMVEDIPVIAIAGSGGGYRAMTSTLGSIAAAQETGLWDLVSFCSAVSGSCWALNTLYSVGEGDIEKTIKHVRERITTPFLDPETVELLTNQPTSQYLLSGAVLKQASKAGDVSIVDAYGTLVSARLYVPSDLSKLDPRHLKISNQRHLIDDGSHPLPIYCAIRHELPRLKELEQQEEDLRKMKKGSKGEEAALEKRGEMVKEGRWMWFECSPYEVGSDELGAWIPTWSLGRLFENGKNVERTPELSLTVMSGIFASAFCATLFSYYNEVRPLLTALPFFSALGRFMEENRLHLDSIHPFPPAELPNFLKGLEGKLREGAPEDITKHDSLGFLDAGANLNIPYVPLFRRDCDIIIALDASADSQDVWFTRAAEYAQQRALHLWPRIDSNALFPDVDPAADADAQAAAKVDAAKAQEQTAKSHPPHRKQEVNPQPPPVGSGPHSAAWEGEGEGEGEGGPKPVPESAEGEPPLGKCNIWIGSSREEDVSCRNDHPTVEDVVARDGIALAYFPLTGGPQLENVTEVWSTWRFEYTEEETDKMVALAKANFKAGEQQLIDLIRGMWQRKKAQREKAEGRVGDE